jgi:hypothetical protein
MAIQFVCPFCHARSTINDRYAGQSGPCAECGKVITIPEGKGYSSELSATQSENAGSNGPKVGSPPPALHRKRSHAGIDGQIKNRMIVALLSITGLGLIIGSIFWFALPAIHKGLVVRQRTMGLASIRQIAAALNSYRREHGSYPTPIVVDKDGKPLYSWRVLILPQLGYHHLYQQFQLAQTWDSPTNMQVTYQMPREFACTGDSLDVALHESNFALLVGGGTLFPPSGPVDISKISDRIDETLLVVETKAGGIKWTAPGDIDASSGVKLGTRPMVDVGGNFADCALAATVDGNPIAIRSTTTGSMIDAMVTPSGREKIDLNTIRLQTNANEETP